MYRQARNLNYYLTLPHRLEEMRRKRIKAAKKAKLAKIKEVQAQIQTQNPVLSEDRLQNAVQDIDASIKDSLKKVNKTLMKKDDRFKDVIGKISKIKRKAENVKIKQDVTDSGKKKKANKGALKNK